MRLNKKVAIVTGGGSGMGEEISKLFAREGAAVVVADVDEKRAKSVADGIKKKKGNAISVGVDVTSEASVQDLVKAAIKKFKRVDILVNCVGIADYGATQDMGAERWMRMINVCLTGVFYCCREAGREMIRKKSGKIINFASTAGLAGVPYMAHYTAAKHGVVGLTRALAVEWGKYNINVNCICPGATLTPMLLKGTTKQYRADRSERVPLGRLATPRDQANVALFLASSESDYLTGGTLCVDGGIFALAASTSRAALRGAN